MRDESLVDSQQLAVDSWQSNAERLVEINGDWWRLIDFVEFVELIDW